MCGFHSLASAQSLGAIEGRVIEEGTSKGIEGVQIRAKGPEGLYKSVSDDQGNYAIRKLPEGIYRLSVDGEHAMRLKEMFRQESIEAGQVLKDVNIVLAAKHAYTIEVSVNDATGKPVEEAELRIGQYILQVNVCMFRPLTGVATDSKGHCSLKLRERSGKYVVLAVKKRVGEGRSEPFVLGEKDESQAVEIKFYKGISLKGRVSDSKGNAIEGARVSIATPVDCFSSSDMTKTDKDGKYEFIGLGKGDKIVTVSRDGYARSKKKVALSESPSLQEANFSLTKGLTICGKVSDDEGNPIHNARVSVSSPGDGRSMSSRVKTDQNGEYCLEDLRAGKYKVRVFKEGYDQVERDNVKAGALEINFTLTTGTP
ncbi:MAG: carboxypeptidase-like regulatory domain-containing protein [Candidatus Aureabacteria bacterium]|nr:carboxypeptidase-like regulatory domain-containing protein [Candidatus Auribacterota bacterium]